MRSLLLIFVLLVGSAAQASTIGEIVAAMPPGTWQELPDTQMAAVFPPKVGHPAWGIEGPGAVVAAWGGAAFDTRRNVLVITGGGHAAYGGNEVYEFSLDTLTWSRVTDPSPYIQDPAHGTDSNYVLTTDGSPISSHTYDGLEYLPTVDKIAQFGGSQWRSGNNVDTTIHLFDPSARTWAQLAKAPTYALEVASAWDSTRNRLLVVNRVGLMSYDPTTDKWANLTNGWEYQTDRVASYDPVQDYLLLIGGAKAKKPIAYVDLAKGYGLIKAPLTGATDVPLWRPGVAWDSARRQFVVWGGGRSVWMIDPETWVAARLDNAAGSAPSNSTPAGAAKNKGIYSKWRYAPAYDVFIGVNSAFDNVWLYKPAALAPPPPVEPPPPDIPLPPPCSADLCVGPHYALKLPSEAAKIAKDGDTVFIAAGQYADCTVWPVSVTIRGIRGRPHIGGTVCDGKAIWITKGAKTTIENVELHGALGGVSNAAAIRHEGKALILRNVEIFDSHNGILTGHDPAMTVEVYDSVFHHMNTVADLAHNIYVGKIGRLVVEGSYFYDGQSGHYIKTLAANSLIAYNRLVDKKGIDAALIDIWGCSDFTLVGNEMTRVGPRYGSMAFIQLTERRENDAWAACPTTRSPKGLVAYNTVFFNNDLPDDPRWASLLHYNYPTPNVLVANNIAIHTRDLITDDKGFSAHGGRSVGNYHTRAWWPDLFVDSGQGDLRLARPVPSEAAEPIGFVPERAPALPVGTVSRTTYMTLGASGVAAP